MTVGGYKDEQGKPWVLPVVRETEVNYLLKLTWKQFCKGGPGLKPSNHT